MGPNCSRSGTQSNRKSSRAGLSRDSGRSSSRNRWRSSSVSCYRGSRKRIGSQNRGGSRSRSRSRRGSLDVVFRVL